MKALKRKLFLSVASLAVCAATLVSTTFAWYVSNTTAEVQNVSGSTAGAGTDGTLLNTQKAVWDRMPHTAIPASRFGISPTDLRPARRCRHLLPYCHLRKTVRRPTHFFYKKLSIYDFHFQDIKL